MTFGTFGGFEEQQRSSFGAMPQQSEQKPRMRIEDHPAFNRGGNSSFGGMQRGGYSSGGHGGMQRGNNGSSNGGYGRQQQQQQNQDIEIKKDFYQEHPSVEAMHDHEAHEFRCESHIRILSNQNNCPKPIRAFHELVVPDYVSDFIIRAGYEKPSPIQAQGWPVALSGRDMIGIAETGSGKTMAFLLPAVIHIMAQNYLSYGESGPICLVLAPTRELAQQIEVEARKIGSSSQIRCTVLVGGTPKGPQIRDLKQGREIVIATPGRLLDLIDMGVMSLHRVSYLCLDEADRMLDMGFERDLRRICEMIRPDRQTLFFSATWPREVQQLARDLCQEDPVHIHIGEGQVGELKANPRITQNVEVMRRFSDDEKFERIQQILQEERDRAQNNDEDPTFKTVIFSMTKKGCEDLARRLRPFGALPIHGDKTQQDRDWSLAQFKNARSGYDILCATDVAARGLDIQNVKCVINYDFPLNIEDYVHRIGRTGRAGKFGVSYSFFVAGDLKNAAKSARELINIMRKAEQNVPEELEREASMGGYGGKGGRGGKGGFGNNRGGYGKGGNNMQRGGGGFGGNRGNFGGGNKGGNFGGGFSGANSRGTGFGARQGPVEDAWR